MYRQTNMRDTTDTLFTKVNINIHDKLIDKWLSLVNEQ